MDCARDYLPLIITNFYPLNSFFNFILTQKCQIQLLSFSRNYFKCISLKDFLFNNFKSITPISPQPQLMDQQQQDDDNVPQDLQGTHCSLCGKKAEFLCGKCFDVGYCKPQHQKIDWVSHRSKCISVADKIKNHNKQKFGIRTQIFDLLADGRFYEAAESANRLLEQERKFCETSPSFQNELEYGASAVLLTRTWIYYKDFNKALDVLNAYIQHKMPFLKSTQNLPIDAEGLSSNPEKKDLVQKKLNLISAVAAVSHELIRNAMDIIQILINHMEIIYGANSLELSNMYFYTANYLSFLNQPNKSFACFLKAAKLRGNKCATSYYNAAIVCLELKSYSTALDVLLLALNNLTQTQRSKHPEMETNIYQALGVTYKNLNIYTKCVTALQRALCMREKTKHKSYENQLKYKHLIVLLSTIKAETEKTQTQIKLYALPKEKPLQPKYIDLNINNFKNINHVDKPLNEEEENQDWVESFNDFKKKLSVVSKVPQVPHMVKAKLFGKDRQEVVREEDVPSVVKSKEKGIEQKVYVSLDLIETFNSTEMDFLNELNRLIEECKEKSAIIDIFENSNLYQTISREKLQMLYRLNPKFLRNTREAPRNMKMQESAQQVSENFSREYTLTTTPQKKNKIITPKLNLEGLKKNI